MKRKLTINFHRAVTDPKLETLEVVVTPLSSASHPENDQTILGLKQTRKVTLREPVTSVVFELTPTYQVGLDRPIFYRIAWRRGSFGRIESHEFSMPNQDVDFDDLFDLGEIVSGEEYLTWKDAGIANGVARLNDEGQVIDANGNVILSGDTSELAAMLDNEVRQREAADISIRTDLRNEFTRDIGKVSGTWGTALSAESTRLQELISSESNTRRNEDESIRALIQGVQGSISVGLNTVRSEFVAADVALDARKADLVNGKVPVSQIPDVALGTVVVVENELEMLQLTSAQVQPGDLAARPDGTFMLVLPLPGDPASWRRITAPNSVVSVNGNTGAVELSYNDVGARSATAPIPMDDILGLDSALSSKADGTALSALNTRISSEADRTTTLTNRVDGMQGAWTKAVADARTAANDSQESANNASLSAANASESGVLVTGIKNDILALQGAINLTSESVNDDAAQVRADKEMTAEVSAAAITAAELINGLFQEITAVTSVNGVLPDENGNVSIFGGGTTLSLSEDPDNPGLYHVSA